MAESNQPQLVKTEKCNKHQYQKATPLQVTLVAVADQKQKTNYLAGAWQQRRCPDMHKTAELMGQHGEDLTKKGKMLEDEAKELAKYYMFVEERRRNLDLKTKNFINDAKTFFADVESQHKELGCWDAAKKKQMQQINHLSIWDKNSLISVGRYSAPSLDSCTPIGRGARRRHNLSS